MSKNTYTQFVLNANTDEEEAIETLDSNLLIVPPGTTVFVAGERYESKGSTVYVNRFSVSVSVELDTPTSPRG